MLHLIKMWLETPVEQTMRMWKRKHGEASEAPANEKAGNR